MRHIRVLICQVDDSTPNLMSELACFDLATPDVATLQPETALDALEATTQEIGTAILRRLLHAQWDQIDAALVARRCAQVAPAVVQQDGQETVTVASRSITGHHDLQFTPAHPTGPTEVNNRLVARENDRAVHGHVLAAPGNPVTPPPWQGDPGAKGAHPLFPLLLRIGRAIEHAERGPDGLQGKGAVTGAVPGQQVGIDEPGRVGSWQARATWEFLDFLANSMLFLLMGLAVRPIGDVTVARLGLGIVWALLVAVLAVLVARVVVAWAVGAILAHVRQPLPRGWRRVLTWAGLRGAVSFAAALSLPAGLPERDLLLTLTFGVVLFTILVQGLTIRPLMERLGLAAQKGAHDGVELTLGRLRITEAAAREVQLLRRAHALDEDLARRLIERYTTRGRELRTQLDATSHSSAALVQQQKGAALRHLAQVQHEVARDAYARGQLSGDGLRALITDIDGEIAALDGTEATSRTPMVGVADDG